MLNAKVNNSILALVRSGTLDAADAAALASGLGAGVSSLQDISTLPEVVQGAVKDAFRNGSRWAFLSLLPWTALGMIATLFLSNIRDTDREAREALAGAAAGGQTPEVEKKQVTNETTVVAGEPRP